MQGEQAVKEARTVANARKPLPSQHKGADPWSGDIGLGKRRLDLLSLIPLVSIAALVVLVGALVWVLNGNDEDRARTKLATDALWVEQTLRFQHAVDEDALARLALDRLSGTEADLLETRARLHVAANPEVLSVIWYDPQGGIEAAVPGPAAPNDPELVALLLGGQVASTRPVYGKATSDRVTFGIRAREGGGVVTATISLSLMLERHIPWWITEQYAVQLLDTSDTVLAERASRSPRQGNPTHEISFDPPLRGAIMRITLYEPKAAFANRLITAAIAGLAGFAILALMALYRNAQRRRDAELRLRSEMAFRHSMEDSLTVGLRAKDHSGRILFVNPAFCNLVGWPADVLIGHGPPMPYWAPDRLPETLSRQAALAAAGAVPQSFETRFLRHDGVEIEVQVYEAPLIDAQGTHRGWMGSVIDITEAKRAARLARAQDESLARTGRLVTLGEMASTLAHELNQPLSAIAAYAAGALNLLEQGKADPAVLTPALEKLQLQARRAGQIIRGIQDFVKKREPRFSDLALAEVIMATVGFLTADARENRVTIVTDLEPVGHQRGDRILLEQVLINLIRNGMESMQDRNGGTLLVTLRGRPNGGAVIEVADQGGGIPPAFVSRLFDPFTSTKAEGMGMGLNICRSIIELHRGQLTHRPRPEGGTIFSVTLPGAPERHLDPNANDSKIERPERLSA